MLVALAIICGFVLDLIFGDPGCIPHPVVIMGRIITALEKRLRSKSNMTAQQERHAGMILAAVLPVGTLLFTGAICFACYEIHPLLFLAIETFWCWQAFAAKGLVTESMNVSRKLEKGDLCDARKAVSRIVGRDTEQLTHEGVIKATVETVAENFSDGVIAPLFWMMIGGAPLALTYKSINTMDSMVGYKNERYINFGRAAAKLDDAANFIPSRTAALLWILASGLMDADMRSACRIWRRDSRKHASPNSAQTESACAGALGIQLAGPAVYFGELYDKPYIGDPTREVVTEDIRKTDRIMICASIIGVILAALIRFI